MSSICFLISTRGTPRNDNHTRLPRAWAAAGWSVVVADHNELRLSGGEIGIARHHQPLRAFDLIWLIGLGERASFLDRMQLLRGAPPRQFINSPDALLSQHAKYQLPLGPLADHHPETYASCDAAWLLSIVAQGGEWIAKPPAASFGRDVFRVSASDPNLRVIIERLTGQDGSNYCVLQRYVDAIGNGETRVLIAAGEIIGAYRRHPGADHRANLSGTGHAGVAALSPNEMMLARDVARWLQPQGINFLAVDIAYPWIVEINLANPGGMQTIEQLIGTDVAPAAASALIRHFARPAERLIPAPASSDLADSGSD